MEVEDSMKEIFSINKHAASMPLVLARVFRRFGTERSEPALKRVYGRKTVVYSICGVIVVNGQLLTCR